MVDRPIIMSAPMVSALLAGRKTMTRRLATSPLAKAQAGDRLWVRETWTLVPWTAYAGSDGVEQRRSPHDSDDAAIYRAGWDRSGKKVWRPCIHMPRWASRITLTVTSVRTEKLHAITDADIQAEGLFQAASGRWVWEEGEGGHVVARNAFASLWMSLHVLGPATWGANPEVVAISFTVARQNIDAE